MSTTQTARSEIVEAAARAVERAEHPEWTEEQFEVWWSRDPFFCEKVTAWTNFTGTRKAHAIWKAGIALQSVNDGAKVEWRPASEAPDGWHRTYRLGEVRPTLAAVRNHPFGEQEWYAPDGRTTVTHSTYASPTHYLAFELPPLPKDPA